MVLNNLEKSIALLFESDTEIRKTPVLLGDKENELLHQSLKLITDARAKIVQFCINKNIHYEYEKAIINIAVSD